jgi:hypothetical protein
MLLSWSPPVISRAEESGYPGSYETNVQRGLQNFLRHGFFLTPSVLRRCSMAKGLKAAQRSTMRSILTHILPIVEYTKPKVPFLLGDFPILRLLLAFPGNLERLRQAYETHGTVKAYSEKLMNSPQILRRRSGHARVFVSYWPRGEGICYLATDVKRIISTQALKSPA